MVCGEQVKTSSAGTWIPALSTRGAIRHQRDLANSGHKPSWNRRNPATDLRPPGYKSQDESARFTHHPPDGGDPRPWASPPRGRTAGSKAHPRGLVSPLLSRLQPQEPPSPPVLSGFTSKTTLKPEARGLLSPRKTSSSFPRSPGLSALGPRAPTPRQSSSSVFSAEPWTAAPREYYLSNAPTSPGFAPITSWTLCTNWPATRQVQQSPESSPRSLIPTVPLTVPASPSSASTNHRHKRTAGLYGAFTTC